VHYPFPDRLPADIVLASCEREDHNASSRLFGAPQAFRSVTGIGLNNARGLFFRGTRTYLDKEQGARGGTNTVFGFTLDGVRIVHLGYIGHIPTASQREEIGTADVLFLPVGNKDLSPADLARIVSDFNAKIVIPICFGTQYSGSLDLRSLDDFLAAWKGPVKRIGGNEITLSPSALPKETTLYVLDYPPKGQ
ncbi:MAG TPA: MBL fold metallo-hydrolase, partial [Candidatus Methylacidiphilales bacterium]